MNVVCQSAYPQRRPNVYIRCISLIRVRLKRLKLALTCHVIKTGRSVFHSFDAALLIGREIMLFAAEIALLTKTARPQPAAWAQHG